MLQDLEFTEIPVRCLSSQGTPYVRWVRVGMPKIAQDVVHSVFYHLYRTVEDAQTGTNACGTGFIVQHDFEFYGVSNRHVVCDAGASVIRLNGRSGPDVFDFGPEDWEHIPSGDDIAVVPIALDMYRHSVRYIHSGSFVHERTHDLGVGDDVFMVGLFVDHEGHEKNTPLARFGNISMLPARDSPIRMHGREYVSFIVDMHSRSGFSGSPVFVYRTLGGDLTGAFGETVAIRFTRDLRLLVERGADALEVQLHPKETLFQLLGIHWAQFPERWELAELTKQQDSLQARHLITDKTYVDGFSGMTCVAPAWKILEVLNLPKLKQKRADMLAKRRGEPKLEAVKPPPEPKTESANPRHREDFNNLLDAAVKGKPTGA
jgi:hypothetical protein